MLVFWLLGAGLALLSLRGRGCVYGLLIYGATCILLYTAFCTVMLGIFMLTGAVHPPWPAWVVPVLVIATVAGVLLIYTLGTVWELPRWLERSLPVRGIYARRLLTALALALIIGPGVWGLAVAIGIHDTPHAPLANASAVILGFAAYFAPLWHGLTYWGQPKAMPNVTGEAALAKGPAPE